MKSNGLSWLIEPFGVNQSESKLTIVEDSNAIQHPSMKIGRREKIKMAGGKPGQIQSEINLYTFSIRFAEEAEQT